MTIEAARALYIKLGEKGCWVNSAFQTNTIRVGYPEITHEMALAAVAANDFTAIKQIYERSGNSPGTATRYANELREFYTAGPDVLWITFAEGRMWWCFAKDEVMPIPAKGTNDDGSRYRETLAPWTDTDITGERLWKHTLRGSLTTTEGFRGTICRIREFEYLLRRLNGEKTPAAEAVNQARHKLVEALVPLIRGLHWKDFELLVELVVTQGGWRRVTATGGTQHATDLELELPFTGERALIQVKSRLEQRAAEELASALLEQAAGARVIIAYHSSGSKLAIEQERVSLLGPNELAEHVVDSGLSKWVIQKVG